MIDKKLINNLEIWGFENRYIIFEDSSYGFGFEITTKDISCSSNENINSLMYKVDSFLNSLKEGLDVQFIADIKPSKIDFSHTYEKSISNTNELSQSISNHRFEKFNNLQLTGSLPSHKLYFFLRKPGSNFKLDKPKFFSKPKAFVESTEAQMDREISDLKNIEREVFEGLKNSGLNCMHLSQDKIVELIFDQWNPDGRIGIPNYDPDDIRDSILLTDMKIEDDGFKLGKIHHRVISLKTKPDASVASMAQVLRQLPINSRLSLSIHIPNQISEMEKLKRDRRVAYAMVTGKKGVNDIEGQAKLSDLDELIEELVVDGQKIFQVSLNIVLRDQDKFSLEEKVSQTLMTLREMCGSEGFLETNASVPVFTDCSIPNSRCKERQRPIKTKNLSEMLPLFGPWEGTASADILLRSRLGSLVKFDPFSSTFTNSNMMISGGSGSGKSFLTNLLLLQMLPKSPKVFIVDIGGSYKKLCENLNGHYIPFGSDTSLSINPFDLEEGSSTPSNQKIKYLVGLVEQMTKEEDEVGLSRIQRTEIEVCIQELYRSKANPRLSDLKLLLQKSPDREISMIGKILESWCGDTPYGCLVDRPTNIDLKNELISFDLKGMENYPDLQRICLFLITDLVWREVQTERGRRKFVVFDECWKLLESSSGSSFIGEVFRTFRKYYASAIAISQNIDDLAKSRVASAIVSNCSIKWILSQRGADKKRLAEVLRLNSREIQLIESLDQEKGFYSEAFLIAEEDRSVVVVEPTPIEYWLATTDPRDLDKANNLESNDSKLEILAEQFPHGVSAILEANL